MYLKRTKMTSRNYYRSQRNNFEILTIFAASEEVRRNKKVKIKKLIPQVNNIEVKNNSGVLRRMAVRRKAIFSPLKCLCKY